MKYLIVAALFAVLLAVTAGEEHHKMCCSACKSRYTQAHHLKHSCLRGCRLYAMIYLAHDKTIANTELSGMCSKSCQSGFSGMPGGADGNAACLTGCSEQERVFREHGLDEHGAKLTVMHGIGLMAPPDMHSASPFHQRIFQQMQELHQRMLQAMAGAKHAVIQRIQIRIHSLPPGPDGKPRYQVEIHQHRVPFVFGGQPPVPGGMPMGPPQPPMLLGGDGHDMQKHHGGGGGGHEHHHGNHHQEQQQELEVRLFRSHHGGDRHHHHRDAMYRVRHFFTDMSEPAKVALRWSLLALLLASVICLGWLCCRACRGRAARARAATNGGGSHHRLSLTKAFVKQKPCVQSGDIFFVDVNDKKPLIEQDALADSNKEAEDDEEKLVKAEV